MKIDFVELYRAAPPLRGTRRWFPGPQALTTGVGSLVNRQLLSLVRPEQRHFIESRLEGPWTPGSSGARFGTRLHRATPLSVAIGVLRDRGLSVAPKISRRRKKAA